MPQLQGSALLHGGKARVGGTNVRKLAQLMHGKCLVCGSPFAEGGRLRDWGGMALMLLEEDGTGNANANRYAHAVVSRL